MNTLPARIEFLLSENHWTPAELARQAGVSRAAVSDWRSGKVKRLTADVALRISAACDVNAMWIATGVGEPRQADTPRRDASQLKQPTWPFRSIEAARYEQLPEAIKGMIESRALSLIEEWEASTKLRRADDAA